MDVREKSSNDKRMIDANKLLKKRGALAKDEMEKMMGCKLEDMTDNQKTIGLAMLVSFESQWNK